MPPINFPYLGNSLIMAIFILVHVFFAFVAVGGIIIACATEWRGYRKKNPFHDRFAQGYINFISEMMKLGGVLGVTIVVLLIGLFPEFTKKLYNIFFWPLVMEAGLFFILMASTIYYKLTWHSSKNKPRHIIIGAVAALSAILSALVINAAHAFMLTPGGYFDNPNMWKAVFNPTMLASSTHLLIPCVANAGAFAFIYAFYKSRRLPQDAYYSWLTNYSGSIFAAAILFQPLSGLSFLFKIKTINEEVYMNIVNGPVSQFFWPMVGLGVLAVLSSIIYLSSRKKASTVLLIGCLAALTAFSFGGYTRERARKPYLIYGHMYMSEAQAAEEKPAAVQKAASPKDALGSKGCLACHKYDGAGGTLGPNLNEHLPHHTKEDLKKILRNPPKMMPPFKGSDDELNSFVDTIKGK